MTQRFKAVTNGRNIVIDDSKSFFAYLATMPKEIYVIVKDAKEKRQRSSSQNRYFHGPLLDDLTSHFAELGYTKQEVKEIVKFKFLSETVVIDHEDGTTEEIEHIRQTSSLNTVEFEEFNRSIREWASTLGCSIKEPNE